jgi:hypothetical protein
MCEGRGWVVGNGSARGGGYGAQRPASLTSDADGLDDEDWSGISYVHGATGNKLGRPQKPFDELSRTGKIKRLQADSGAGTDGSRSDRTWEGYKPSAAKDWSLERREREQAKARYAESRTRHGRYSCPVCGRRQVWPHVCCAGTFDVWVVNNEAALGLEPDARESFCRCSKQDSRKKPAVTSAGGPTARDVGFPSGYANSRGYANGHSRRCEAAYLNKQQPTCVKADGGCGSKYHATVECVQSLRRAEPTPIPVKKSPMFRENTSVA